MRILISNDDGIEAEGLEALVKYLSSHHEVIVSAPFRQQSGMSHALTVGAEMELIRGKRLMDTYGIEAWAVDGTPTDAVKLYLEALADVMPDVVLSGINHGANLATDILYSGTVGAAMEGYLHDISSFAVSADIDSVLSYTQMASLFCEYLETVMENRKEPIFYNVNFPRELVGNRPLFVMGRQGKRDYKNAFCRIKREDDRIFYIVRGEIFDTDKSEPTDIYAVEHGMIAVTPLMTDMTDYLRMEQRLHEDNS